MAAFIGISDFQYDYECGQNTYYAFCGFCGGYDILHGNARRQDCCDDYKSAEWRAYGASVQV